MAAALAALSRPGQPHASFEAIDRAIEARFGRAYTTILRVTDGLHTERVFSTVPDTYPLGVRKTLPDTPRARGILSTGEPFVANSVAEIAAQYPDHDVVVGLGASNLANLPVVYDGEVIGLLCVAGGGGARPPSFGVEAMPFAQLLAAPLLATG
jgi:GAF domain-containing protein